jgi:hypothetical protein
MNFLTYFNYFFNWNPNSFLNKAYPFLKEIQPLKGGGEENLLGYYITIELIMKKGEEITPKELKKIK